MKAFAALRSGKILLCNRIQFKGVCLFQFQAVFQVLFDVELICLVIIRQLFVSGMFGDIILIGEEWPDATHLQDALSAVHDGKFVLAHQFFATMSSDELKKSIRLTAWLFHPLFFHSSFAGKSEWSGGERHRGQGSDYVDPMFRPHRYEKTPGQQKAIRAQNFNIHLQNNNFRTGGRRNLFGSWAFWAVVQISSKFVGGQVLS